MWIFLLSTALAYVLYNVYVYIAPISTSIPIVGGLTLKGRYRAMCEYATDPIRFLQNAEKKYGKVFQLDLIFFKFIFFTGIQGVVDVANCKEEEASFVQYVAKILGTEVQYVIDYKGGDWFHTHITRYVRSGLLGPGRVGGFLQGMNGLAKGHFASWASQPHGVPLFESMSTLVFHHACHVMFGGRFVEKHREELISLCYDFVEGPLDWRIRLLPSWAWEVFEGGRKVNGSVRRLRALLKDEIALLVSQNQQDEGLDGDQPEREDLMAFILAQKEKTAAIDALPGLFLILIFALWANTTPHLAWMIVHAGRSSKSSPIVKRWKEDLSSYPAIGERKPYIEACIREVGRLYGFLNSVRLTSKKKSIQVQGYRIPKGTAITSSPAAATHHNSLYFEEPEKFRPERFLEEEAGKRAVDLIRSGALFQFGKGEHVCPGEKIFKGTAADLVLKSLLEEYEWEFLDLPSKEEGVGFDGVGLWPSWLNKNYGTAFAFGDATIRLIKKTL